MTEQLYLLASVRDLLVNGFDDQDLRRLAHDIPDSRPVHDRLARNTGKVEIVDQFIEYAERTLQIDMLLALAKVRNPARCEQHGQYYVNDPTLASQRQVANLAERLAAITSLASLTSERQYQIAFHWEELGCQDSLRGFDLQETNLRGAYLCEAELRGANLTKADLTSANLSRADLRVAILTRAILHRADLTGADLCEVDLGRADLCGANLHPAMLDGVDLRGGGLRAAGGEG